MDKNIGIGFIIGLLITSTLYIYNSNKFNSYQKGFLYFCILFPPLQWVSIVIILIFNKLKLNSSVDGIATSKTKLKFKEYNIQLQNLKELENRGIITENEFNEKSNDIKKLRIESKLKLSPDFKKLKELFDSDILTEDEFNNKVQILRKNMIQVFKKKI